jgi:O-antigen ligase
MASSGKQLDCAKQRWQQWLLIGCVALLTSSAFMTGDSTSVGEGLMTWPLWAWFGLLLSWTACHFWCRDGILRVDRTLFLMLASVAVMSVSFLATRGMGDERMSINGLWQWIGFAAVFTLCLQCLRPGREMRAIVVVMLAAATAIACVGIYDSLVQIPNLRMEYFNSNETGRMGMLQQAGIGDAAIGSPMRYQFESRLQSPEPFVTFALTNSLAGFLAPWLLIILGMIITTQRTYLARSTIAKSLILVFLISVCLLLTKSRSAWCAVLIGAVYLTTKQFKVNRERIARGLCLTGVLLAVAVGCAWFTNRLDMKIISEASNSLLYRFEYWRSSMAMVADHWLWGVGAGNFRDAYMAYKLPVASEAIADPHNAFLEILTSFGTPVALLMLGVFGIAIIRIFKPVAVNFPTQSEVSSIKIFIGGALGIVLAIFMDALGPGLIPDRVLYFGFPIFAIAIYLLQDWVENGELTRVQIGGAFVVWLFNLSMQSGISVPGVSITGWMLLAMLLNCEGTLSSSSAAPTAGYKKFSRNQLGTVLVGALLVLGTFHFTGHHPVTQSATHLLRARYYNGQGQSGRAMQSIDAAIAVDPTSARAYELKTNMLFHRLAQNITPTGITDYLSAMKKVKLVHANSYPLHITLAQQCFVIYQATAEKIWLQRAVELTKMEVALFPSSAYSWGRLAIYESISGSTTAVVTAKRALELDEQNPHLEFKLENRRFIELDYQAWKLQNNLLINNAESLEQLVQEVRKGQ